MEFRHLLIEVLDVDSFFAMKLGWNLLPWDDSIWELVGHLLALGTDDSKLGD